MKPPSTPPLRYGRDRCEVCGHLTTHVPGKPPICGHLDCVAEWQRRQQPPAADPRLLTPDS